MQTQLRRFADALGDALVERGLDPSRPFTVAEIYQDFVPYRTHRDLLGVEMNGDYEHLLLRLLAGEGDILQLQSTAALNQIRAELDETNPNTGLYREFAAVDVKLLGWIAPPAPAAKDDESPESEGIDFFGAAPAEPDPDIPDFDAPMDPDPEPIEAVEDTPTPVEAPDIALVEDTVEEPMDDDAPQSTPEAAVTAHDDGTACAWCRQVLPDRPNLNFCPFCGTDMRIVPCGSCGEALEPGWRFCIACGTEVVSEA